MKVLEEILNKLAPGAPVTPDNSTMNQSGAKIEDVIAILKLWSYNSDVFNDVDILESYFNLLKKDAILC